MRKDYARSYKGWKFRGFAVLEMSALHRTSCSILQLEVEAKGRGRKSQRMNKNRKTR
jgi:hypothetical protein